MIWEAETFFKNIIETDRQEYQKIKNNISDFYYRKEVKKLDQFGNVKTDQNGEPEIRVLIPPKGKLKGIQKLINSRIFSQIDFPPQLHGSIREKSCITNAREHQGNKYFFLTDLRNYFPTINNNLVYEALIKLDFSPEVASLITRLVTYKGCIPQGAPTSPAISNLVFLPYDSKIIKICKQHELTYTRYIDDLTFSSKNFIPKAVIQNILDVIRHSPFKFHPRKTKTNIGITEVTGVLVKNNGLVAPERKFQKLEKLKQNSKKAIGLRGHIKAISKK
ncbi:RNA-directed DNA polymerase [Balneolaceae bacterium YR4-1]|uniref:RNA-directed DNA polymerase n=1 Tax=Halalkalibaculum roseum TaxID=2709311 RepID=A0A6M1SU45_9BACT|nr:reverse transcriptase family protein [Halalkalibaculum roseum]NGP75628.1 RNA-directed DNA polymerase [Halalkalibaculum roseum]